MRHRHRRSNRRPWELERREEDRPVGRPWRGWVLGLLALPLVPTFFIVLLSGQIRPLAGLLVGGFLLLLALRRLRRDASPQAAGLVALATFLLALLGARLPAVAALVLGAMAFLGTRLLYDQAAAPAPEPLPPVEPPAPPPPPPPEDLLAPIHARFEALREADPVLRPACFALGALLADLAPRPERVVEMRRFLNMQLEGLERIDARLRAGAEPPPSLPALVEDMAAASQAMRERLRAAETEALDIQVKVLADRLRQEGLA